MENKGARQYKQMRRTRRIRRALAAGVGGIFAAGLIFAVVFLVSRTMSEPGAASEPAISAIEPIEPIEQPEHPAQQASWAASDIETVETTEIAENTGPAAADAAAGADSDAAADAESDPAAGDTAESDAEASVPAFLSSLDGYAPGTVIDAERIDTGDLGRYFSAREIQPGDAVYQRIYGRSYVDNNDIALSDLRYLTMLHVNFDGRYQVGEMIVNASAADQIKEIFRLLCEAKYEIYSMYLIDDFWVGNGTDSDTNSIDHNNTSCFCYRPATGSSHISRHALGLAVDLNPQQNPYVTIRNDGSLSYAHQNAAPFVSNRSSDTPHVITEADLAYQLFTARGWTWGGSWNNPKDYQHFQYSE